MKSPALSPLALRAAALGVSAIVAGCAATPDVPPPPEMPVSDTLTILHTNDFHSRIRPISEFDGPCDPEDNAAGECYGGWARMVSAIAAGRDRDPDAMLVDGGDQFQGSLFYTRYKGEVAAEMMNAPRYDAMTVGNHEFDDGPEVLSAFVERVDFPVLMSNADISEEPALDGKILKSTVIEKGGVRYGLVGLTTPDTVDLASPGENVRFTDPAEALQEEIERLEADGVNRIVVLSHSGMTSDLDIATRVKGIDVIVGGHSNTYLSNTDESADGPYPTMVGRTAIVQAYAYGKYLGELSVTFDEEGAVSRATGAPLIVDGQLEEDAGTLARIDELAAPLEEIMREVVSESGGFIEGDRSVCRVRECPMGNLVAEAMLEAVRDQGVSIALMNAGGIRASIDEGEITMGEVLTVLPFQNLLSTFTLTGADLVVALENGVSDVEGVAGRFPQVAGMSYAFDLSQPVGGRVSDVMVMRDGQPEPLDPEASYRVVSNDYLRGGGDGYDVLAERASEAYDFGPSLDSVVAEYLAANAPYRPATDGRITAR